MYITYYVYYSSDSPARWSTSVCVCVYTYTRRNDDNNNNETDIMFVQLMILLLLLLSCVCNSPADDRDRGGIFPRGSDQKKTRTRRGGPRSCLLCASRGGPFTCAARSLLIFGGRI